MLTLPNIKGMKIGKKLFYKVLQIIQDQEGKDLKITLIKDTNRTKSGVHGEYIANKMWVATGEEAKKADWYMNIGTLIHEYAHHQHEKYRRIRDNDKVYLACAMLYGRYTHKIDRIEYGKITMLDEYQTDADAYELLKKLHIHHLYRDWWQMANWYNLKIKYYIETGTFIYDLTCKGMMPLSNKRWPKRKIQSRITPKEKKIIDRLVKKGKFKLSMIDYKNVH